MNKNLLLSKVVGEDVSLTQKDKEALLDLIERCKTIEDLKLALSTLVILEDFAEK